MHIVKAYVPEIQLWERGLQYDSLLCRFTSASSARKCLKDAGWTPYLWCRQSYYYLTHKGSNEAPDIWSSANVHRGRGRCFGPYASVFLGFCSGRGERSCFRDSGGKRHLFSELSQDVACREFRRAKRYSGIRDAMWDNEAKVKSRRRDNSWKTFGKKRHQWDR